MSGVTVFLHSVRSFDLFIKLHEIVEFLHRRRLTLGFRSDNFRHDIITDRSSSITLAKSNDHETLDSIMSDDDYPLPTIDIARKGGRQFDKKLQSSDGFLTLVSF